MPPCWSLRRAVYNSGILPALVSHSVDSKDLQHWNLALSQKIAGLAEREILVAEEGVESLQSQSSSHQARLHAVKASCLTGYLCCSLVDEDAADTEKVILWAENTIADRVQAADETLASAALQCLTILAGGL